MNLPTDATRSGNKPPDDGLTPLDCAVLRHVGLYHLTFRQALSATIVPEAIDVGNTLAALTRLGYLRNKAAIGQQTGKAEAQDGEPLQFPGKRKYYILGPKGTKLLGLPKERHRPPQPAALAQQLAVLWYCAMGRRRRYRLDHAQLKSLVPKNTPHANVPHCVADEKDGAVLYRLYASAAEPREIVKEVRKMIRAADAHPTLGEWLTTGDYGIAVLVETEAKRRDLKELIGRSTRERPPLSDSARIDVGLGPSPETLGLAIRQYQERSEAS